MRMMFEQNHEGGTPNLGYIAGWVMEYNIKALLKKAIENGDLTRDGGGIRAAAGMLDDVDYEDMLPNRSFVGDPSEISERQSVVNKIDTTSPDGTALLTPFFVGPTATAYDYTAPCVALGG
jgi:hypothetical protein